MILFASFFFNILPFLVWESENQFEVERASLLNSFSFTLFLYSAEYDDPPWLSSIFNGVSA